jgi:exopolysaccharide biosynthesis polyprenyl glycosylphosphotransferase
MQRRYVGTNTPSNNGSSTTKAIERVLAGEAEAHAPTSSGPAPPALRGGALRRYRDIALGLALSDAVCVVVALAVAYYLRFPDRPMLAGEAIVLAVAPVLWVAVFHAFDLYAPQHLSAPEEFRRLIGASSVGIVLLMMASYWSKSSFSRGWVAISWILVLLLELIPRRWWRAYQWRLRMDGRLALRTLVVGTSAQAARLVEILSDRASGFLPVGQVRAADPAEDGFAGRPRIRVERDQVPSPLPVLGGVGDLDRLIREQGAECVFVAPPGIPVDDMAQVAWTASRQRVEVRVLANLPQTLTSRLALVKVGPAIAFALKPVRLSGRQAAAKRAFDLVVASAALLLSLPLFLLIALWIRLDSGGPVYFHQERVTKDGRVFRMHKFRTMRTGGAVPGDAARPFFKLEDDPRLTRAGAFLRRYSLDELPQFWNVLVGEMSIVGPRPLPLAQVTANLELLAARHVVPAGVTGWWQINGRSLATPEEALRLDLFYIENWSLALDLYVVLKTFGAVLGRQGAY